METLDGSLVLKACVRSLACFISFVGEISHAALPFEYTKCKYIITFVRDDPIHVKNKRIVMIRMVTVTPQEMDASQWSVTKSSENPTVCNWVPTAVWTANLVQLSSVKAQQ